MMPGASDADLRPVQRAEAADAARRKCGEARRRGCAAPAIDDDVRQHVMRRS
jgi:hypothetical protein